MLAGQLQRSVGELLRCQQVRPGVGQVPRAVRGCCDRRRPLAGLAQRVVVAPDEDEPLERRFGFRVRLPASRVVGSEHEPVDDGTGLLGVREAERVVEKPGERTADALGLLRDLRRGRAQSVGVELRRRTEPDEHEPAGPLLSSG